MIKILAVSITLLSLLPNLIYCQTPQWDWAKGFGGDYVDKANALITDADGNVYMAGEFYSSSITFGNTTLYNAGYAEIFIVKLDSSGEVIWANSFQGLADSENKITGLTVDAYGNLILTGNFESSSLYYKGYEIHNTSLYDFFVAKIDPNSNLLWMKASVGSGNEMSNCVCTDHQNNIFVAGYFQSDMVSYDGIILENMGNGIASGNAFIFKLNENGQAISGTNFGEDEDEGIIIKKMKTNPDGNIVFSGNFTTSQMVIGADTIYNLDTISSSSWDAYVIEMTPDFEFSVVKQIAGTEHDYIYDMDIDNEGNVVVTGYFNSNPLIIGSDTLSYIPPNIDMFTALISSSGDFLWAKAIGDDPIVAANYNCVFDTNGSIFINGQYWNDTLFIANDTLVGHTFPDLFLLKYTQEGEIKWCIGAGDEGFDESYALTIDKNDNIFMSGSFSSNIFIIGSDSLVNIGASDCFLAKFSEYKRQDSLPGNFLIFPNPSDGYITINPGSDFALGYNLEVTNILGQCVLRMQANNQEQQEIFLPYSSGIYCVTIHNQLTSKTARFFLK